MLQTAVTSIVEWKYKAAENRQLLISIALSEYLVWLGSGQDAWRVLVTSWHPDLVPFKVIVSQKVSVLRLAILPQQQKPPGLFITSWIDIWKRRAPVDSSLPLLEMLNKRRSLCVNYE